MGGGKVVKAEPFTASDDVAFLSERVPFVYFQLGAGVPGNPHAHHNPGVLFDEKALAYGAAIHAQCAFEWLRHHS
jgi:metal-dependent amidase/aminoacylase/carboxypeptidase family protein